VSVSDITSSKYLIWRNEASTPIGEYQFVPKEWRSIMSGSCCGGSPETERPTPKTPNMQKTACGCEASHASEGSTVKQLPIVWRRLVSDNGRTCPRCNTTSQHLQSAVAKLKEVLKPLNVEPILEFREIDESSFRSNPAESNRIWIGGKPLEEWLGASIGSSTCCSVCGDASCRTMEVEGTVFEEIPEGVIVKAALIAASGLMG
jgi:hypothetical protein